MPGHTDTVDTMLTDRDRAILDFEARTWTSASAKEDAIRATFGWSTARYYQALKIAATKPEALESHAFLIHRLVDAELTRARKRANRSL